MGASTFTCPRMDFELCSLRICRLIHKILIFFVNEVEKMNELLNLFLPVNCPVIQS